MKKRALALVLALALVFVSGCNKPKEQETGGEGDNVKVSISFWEPSTNKEMETALKEITANYTKLHPNVTFDLQNQPVAGYQDWLKARIAADEAPTIQENHANVLMDMYKNDYLLDFKDEFLKPNPYQNNTIWKDMFQEGRLEVVHSYSYEPSFAVPYSALGLSYFYNKDLYAKLGIEEPKTWSEFMSNCEAIQADGVNPVAMMLMKGDAINWFIWHIMTGLYANYFLSSPDLNPNGDIVIHEKELARAIKNGTHDITAGVANEAVNKYLDYAEQLGKYAEGATGLDEAGAKAQFLAGTAGHIMSGSWDLKSFLSNKTFEVGAFSLPSFETGDSPYAGSNMKISATQAFGITNSSKKSKAELDAAVDFMKFFTASESYKTFVEVTYSIPVMVGLDVDPIFSTFIGGSNEPMEVVKSGQTSVTTLQSATSAAMSGRPYDRAKMIKEMQESAIEFAEMVMQRDNVSEADDYGVNDIPVQGKFEKTEPGQ